MNRNGERGQLLLEVLFATTVAALVIGIGAQIANVSLRGTKTSGDRNKAMSVSTEVFDAVRAASTEKWQNLYSLTKPATHYNPTQSSGKWVLSAGDGNVTIDGANYTRFFTVDNVSRDLTTRDVETSYNAGHDDPSTQRVTVTVMLPSGDAVVSSELVTRWRNKACKQTAWSSVGAGPSACPSSSFGSSTSIDTTTVPGSLKLSPQ
jgi:hypothetical protein